MRRVIVGLAVLSVPLFAACEDPAPGDVDAQPVGRVTAIPAVPSTPPEEGVAEAPTEADPEPVHHEPAPEAVDPRAAFDARFPNHGVTFHFLARVRAEPNQSAPVIGYMRRGARFRASERVPGVGCARGWFEVPGDGFVCRGEGFLIGELPPSFEPTPVPPALDDALPYAYAWVPRDDIAQYWHLPTEGEEARVGEIFAGLRRRAEAAAAVPAPEPEAAEEPETVEQAAVDETTIEAPPPPGSADDDTVEEEAPAVNTSLAPVEAPSVDPLEIPDFVRLRMRRGFYVSLDREERDGPRHFYRTVRGAYVRADAVAPNEPPDHRGVTLGGQWQLPVAFVYRGNTSQLRRVGTSNRFREVGRLDKHTPLRVLDTLERLGQRYAVTRGGDLVRGTSLRWAEPVERPAEIGEDERWVHVRLSQQVLVAYEGDTPVFATTVSTGRQGFETPTGVFRIQSKHVSTTMDDLTNPDEAYLIEDVPWTMYFEGNYALHAAFWHDGFGRPRSHGCVNLAPTDARWLFRWAGPELPASWHGVFATRTHPGTAVYVTE